MADVLTQAHTEADSLAGSIDGSAAKAQQVSQRVRRLDTAQSNLEATLRHIDVITRARASTAAVQTALDAHDWHALAEHISAYQDLQNQQQRHAHGSTPLMDSHPGSTAGGGMQRGLDGSPDPTTPAQVHGSDAVIAAARERLLAVVRDKVKASLAAGNATAAAEFLQLYKPLGLPDEGMAAAVSFIQSDTQKKADQLFATLQKAVRSDPGAVDFLAALSATLKAVFQSVREYTPLVQSAFGPDHIVSLIVSVIKDLDNKVPRIVSLFVSTRSLSSLTAAAPAHGTAAAAATGGAQLDPVAVDRLLSELRGLVACCQEFTAFLSKNAAAAVHPRPAPRGVAEALRAGQFAHATHELQAAYVSLERMYLERSIAKAIEMDTVMEGSMMTSMLDDSFFVLKQACLRALSTGSMHCFVSTLSLAISQLTGPLRNALSSTLSGCPSAVVRLFADGSTPAADAVERTAAPANNVVLCAAYAAKMHSTLEAEAAQRFAVASEAEAARSALDDLQQAGFGVRDMAGHFCEQFADVLLQQLLRPHLDILARADFNLAEAQYSSAEAETSWARPLCTSLQHYVAQLHLGLAHDTQQELGRALLARLLQRIEAIVAAKKFTALGGLLLDRDVRALTSGLAEATGQPVRDRLARLNQVVLLLTQETPAEVAELWSDASVTWRLSAAEARALLACRSDLNQAAVAALALP